MERLRLLLLAIFLFTTFANCDHVVHTESGPVRGKTVASGKVVAYLGIPYAEPPIGQLRFAKPVPKASWSDIYNATELPPPCVQLDLKFDIAGIDHSRMTEDCLFLNVWVPRKSDGCVDEGPKAVMFSIHGGGFKSGTASMPLYDGAKLAEHGDVIVVTFNYRIGALGFFVGYTDDAPGNQGLHDQILALQWVKDNARHFNGDPDKITVFGESAGAFSVSLLQISPSSRDLFKRAILQSGSAVNPQYAVDFKMVPAINSMYAQELGCADNATNSGPEAVVECLRNVPAEAFSDADLQTSKKGILVLHPLFGDELFPEGAVNMFQDGQFKESEVLMGVTRDEGSMFIFFIYGILSNQTISGSVDDLFNRTTAADIIRMNPMTKAILDMTTPEEVDRLVQSYLDDVNEESGYSYTNAVMDVFADSIINCGNVFQAEIQSARGDPVYFYMFDHRTASSPFPEWTGAAHGEDLQYVMGNPLYGNFTEEETQLSRDVMRMWSSFAKTGHPHVPGGLHWPRYTSEDPKYYVIGQGDRVETIPDNRRCERWRSIFLGTSDC